ncbi:hypothetical protein KXX16_004761 [Aspergillus fumigatus]|uniref:Uncharacterized protein n=1 Tax=Aspergillus fumigatus (strain CBS 144.89 / FGSC A1163 / CEA10) TaxID=451804 RepID=B0XVE1_ASPFC|nr:conserved hypothetical protein [Aspergillus fumigatus A1163]KAF4283965.1 hypothetical protein CNMCM8689_006674 [Aspergillus fumigatus]KAF4293886.1 hypothetical protein CNMCM8686_005069 [Aspergillus fumigatus]KAH1327812.1 hypothetical protein KXX38_004370 [Aspergillus fumigatus]KAH1333025.1 hypothetical protein KXX47_001823 [Aspergillus fumigatus]
MSLGRHAYRHALHPSSTYLIDHIWISEELLASTFRRFATSQRRYESRVPGPLEARRRLAKRRNTALAGIAGSGPLEDIACLFGRNGREHMKWTDREGRNVHPETHDSPPFPLRPPEPPLPFYSESIAPIELDTLDGTRGFPDASHKTSREQALEEFLRSRPSVTAIGIFVRQLNFDLQREPTYSRLILEHLLRRSANDEGAMKKVVEFLDDPYLNTRGAGNYLCALKHTLSTAAVLRKQPVFDAVIRSLELGLLHPSELQDIIKTISNVRFKRSNGFTTRNSRFLVRFHREMWDAIGRCDVYRHRDLGKEIVDAWLSILCERQTYEDFILAKDVILATQDPSSADRRWVPTLIACWLKDSAESRRSSNRHFIKELLGYFHPTATSEIIIRTTEYMVSTKMGCLLEWQRRLSELDNITNIVSSQKWVDIGTKHTAELLGSPQEMNSTLSLRHQIILRIWMLRALSKSLPQGPLWRKDQRVTDSPITHLCTIYESTLDKDGGYEDLLSSLMLEIHTLGIPSNGLLMSVVELKAAKRRTTRAQRRTLAKLETTKVSFAEMFSDIHAYNASNTHFFAAYEKMVRQIDITDPSFVNHAIEIARDGNIQRIWTLIRLFRCHTPLKIAISSFWPRVPDPSEKALVRYYPEPRTSLCPDPHLAVEMLHLFAISLACSRNISPRRAYALVHWLYNFLMKHNAHVKPSLVRAMYHAGVLRFRRAGLNVAPTQYAYILDRVKEIETPEMVQALMEPPRMGESRK